jgi:hypothetical protein
MLKKKDHKTKEQSEQEQINKRVDAMLDPKSPNPMASKNNVEPPLDIFKDAKTAPELSGKLLGKVDDSPRLPVKKPKPQPQPEDSPADIPTDPVGQEDPLADTETDKAVTDIAAKEGNTLLALQDAIGRKASHVAGDLAEQDRRSARRRRWAWFTFLVLFVILLLLALPLNPYTCRWPVGIRLSVTTDIFPSVCK